MISKRHTGTPSKITRDLVDLAGEEIEETVAETNGTARVIVDRETGQELWRSPYEIARLW